MQITLKYKKTHNEISTGGNMDVIFENGSSINFTLHAERNVVMNIESQQGGSITQNEMEIIFKIKQMLDSLKYK